MEKTNVIKVEINRCDEKQFLPVASKEEGCAHPTKIDKCSFIQEETGYHER